MREWQVKRRERTRQLIELGGLVVKAELVDLADDNRAMLYGAFLDGRQAAKRRWRPRFCTLEEARQTCVRDRCLARLRPICHRRAMTRELTDTILRVVERAPQWIRRDLDAKDPVARIRAEESLAAMIADALDQQANAPV